MSNKKISQQEIKNKELKVEKKKLDKESFKEIKAMFNQYWKVLVLLIGVYILSYLVWHWISRKFILKDAHKGKFGNETGIVVLVAVVRGLLFSLDGFVTSLLKTPFNQMCYAINKAEGIDKKKKNHIITKATESNEHCKETLKKFGILNIGIELISLIAFLIEDSPLKKGIEEKYANYLYISYFIPLFFSGLAIFLIYRELKKIEKSLVVKNVKKSR
ncbi:MAG: hypothetical protein I3273_06745 [Candidatus Moeniiplasma glomeromycotorum]|nr:hypothetical protein [Candidatus Moeniiplasma glomeromycotorum]MCE8168196.1 hypothetical protein [Candidatus Moeniiplasma glomeromycotorum]MCE8169783.1 hypothetical protein [Candidatus Moeniiplasma glomeromycotorum]